MTSVAHVLAQAEVRSWRWRVLIQSWILEVYLGDDPSPEDEDGWHVALYRAEEPDGTVSYHGAIGKRPVMVPLPRDLAERLWQRARREV